MAASKTKGIISITRRPTGWVANFAQSNDAIEILARYKTILLPTPFSDYAAVASVLAYIKENNPGHAVVYLSE